MLSHVNNWTIIGIWTDHLQIHSHASCIESHGLNQHGIRNVDVSTIQLNVKTVYYAQLVYVITKKKRKLT